MFLRKSHIAIDYFLLVEHKNERKKTSLGNGEVFFLLCFSAADRGTKNSQCISGRCREIIGWHCGLWNDGRIRDGIRPLDRQDDKRAPVWPRPPPDSQRAFPFIGFRRHVIIPPILKQPPPAQHLLASGFSPRPLVREERGEGGRTFRGHPEGDLGFLHAPATL